LGTDAAIAGLLFGRLRSAVFIQKPKAWLFDTAMLICSSGMVEDQSITLAHKGSQRPTGHLQIQAEALRRPSQDKATNVWLVPTLSQNHAIANAIKIAIGQALQDKVTLILGRVAIKVFEAGA
jgi:hypothetical protein